MVDHVEPYNIDVKFVFIWTHIRNYNFFIRERVTTWHMGPTAKPAKHLRYHFFEYGQGGIFSGFESWTMHDFLCSSWGTFFFRLSDQLGGSNGLFFSRPCLSTYFIKKKAVYRHFLQHARGWPTQVHKGLKIEKKWKGQENKRSAN